ncbi:MAG: UvrD-helicase domain-containing protein [Chthoniobacteraceae bacterium]|nr:UvrD-helicase domain-containing protein [Chthoniobacteraceae bacterium]
MSFRLFDLNDPQRHAATTTEGPLLILAGAGTGKTRVITCRIAYMAAQKIDPNSILAVTFTNKAANEMRERLAGMVDKDVAKKVTMSTFHALCVRILRTDIEKLGYKKNFTIYDEGDQTGLIKKLITKTAAIGEKLEPNAAKSLISKAKNNGWSAPQDEKTLIGAVFARYQAALKQLNAVDFDDLLLLTVKLLGEHADVRERWQRRYRYIMVDEFQDTNRLQLELVSYLAKRDDGMPPNVAVVGDDDQSIYGWRGAEVSNILEFEQHFPNPTVVKLEQNYRSTNAILNTANALIKNNPKRRPKSLWSGMGDGDKIRLVQAPNDREEAEFIANEIARRKVDETLRFEDFAVLFRMNSQSRLLEEMFREKGIPYKIVGGKSFYDSREVKDVLAYFACTLNADNDAGLLRIINTPPRGISEKTVERALELSIKHKCSLFKGLQLPELRESIPARASEAIAEFVAQLDAWETKLNEPLVDQVAVLRKIIEESNYYDDLRRSCKNGDEALKRESNVRDLVEGFSRYLENSNGGLRGYLDAMALRQDKEEDEKDKEQGTGVMLITLHASKGLEFPHCYLVGLEEGILPHDRSKVEGTLDEERRLLYVGITRAQKTLTMTYCFSRYRYGGTIPCTPSSFIKELDPNLIERIDLKKLLNTPVEAPAAKSRFAAMRAAVERSG